MERPRVILNCATSQDGCLAATDGSPVRFSDDEDMKRVHQLRAACDAILVGVGTVLADDPHLIVKGIDGAEHPVRVILDAQGRTPLTARVLDDAAPTLFFSAKDAPPIPGAHQIRVAASEGALDLAAVLDGLANLGIRSILVEGGEQVLRSFLATGLWDEFTLFQATEPLGASGPRLWKEGGPESLGATVASSEPRGQGTLWTFSPQ